MYRRKHQMMELFICMIDAVIVIASLVLAGCIRYGGYRNWCLIENARMACGAVLLLHIALFYFMKITDGFFRRGRYKELLLSVQYNIMMIICLAFSGFMLKNELMMSRLMMGYFFLIDIILIWFVHLLIRNQGRIFKGSDRRQKNLLIVAKADSVLSLINSFLSSKEIRWTVSGVILLDTEKKCMHDLGTIPVLDRTDDFLGFASRNVVDEVFIQIDSIQKNEKILKKMILEFENMGLVVNLNLDLFDMGFSGEKRIYPLEGYNVVAFSSRLLDYRMVLGKRLMDIIGALIGLCITVPVGLVLAPFLLLESSGPLIFKQERIGQNGRIFNFYKFRSMYVNAEEQKERLLERNEMNGPIFKIEDDPRITRVGRFIRRTSIDELPQFWNVLKGDMSLVGTRPPTVDEFQKYEAYQRRRMSFRPGITGLWQVSGRSQVRDFDEIVKLDLEYIDNWSLALDLKIICKTVIVVLFGKGAE